MTLFLNIGREIDVKELKKSNRSFWYFVEIAIFVSQTKSISISITRSDRENRYIQCELRRGVQSSFKG